MIDKTLLSNIPAQAHLCFQVIDLMSQIQRHRGSILSLLGGSESFGEQVSQLQQSINQQIGQLREPLTQDHSLAWQQLGAEWLVIESPWQPEQALHVFELHNYLIDQLMTLVAELANTSQLMTASSSESTQFSRFIFQEMLQTIEFLGRIRALACYTTALGEQSNDLKLRLGYLNKRGYESCAGLYQQLLTMPGSRFKTLKTFANDTHSKKYSTAFLHKVATELLNGENPDLDVQDMYHVGTLAIDASTTVLKEGITLLSR